MATILGAGDALHRVPRVTAYMTTGLSSYTQTLGFGKMITSMTMTVFYVILYFVWRDRYKVQGKKKYTIAVFALAIVRIALCLLPQNEWLTANPPVIWGDYRNILFSLLDCLASY